MEPPAFESLAECFASVSRRFQGLESGALRNISDIIELIKDLDTCKTMIARADLFSKNEELDEYSTGVLKYLFVDYFLGKAYSNITDLYVRKNRLQQAITYLHSFIEVCMRLEIMNEEEKREYEDQIVNRNTSISPADQRAQKIANYKRDKEANARMTEIRKIMQDSTENGEDFDSETRELMLLQLQTYARDTIKELHSIHQELILLEHMETLRELDELTNTNNASSSNSSSSSAGGGGNGQGRQGPPGLPSSDVVPPKPGEGPGISITRTSKVGDQIVLSRDVIKAEVFVPRMSGPTMTLEEFGEMQLQQALEREQAQKQAQDAQAAGQGPPRRYNQLVADGQEDNEDLVDAATTADREWDDWKESNPKGWGNKMGKRY